MRLFRCQKASCAFWPLDGNEELHPTTSEKDSETADASTLILDLGSSRKPIL